MDIHQLAKDLEILSKQYTHTFNITRSRQWLFLKLTEELGELVQAYLKFTGQTRDTETNRNKKEALEDELADVLGMVLIVAREFELNVEAGLERKWFTHRQPAL